MLDKQYIQTKGIYQVSPVIDFTDELVIQSDVAVAENTFIDDCK